MRLGEYEEHLREREMRDAADKLERLIDVPETWECAEADVYEERHDGGCRWPRWKRGSAMCRNELFGHATFCVPKPLGAMPAMPKKTTRPRTKKAREKKEREKEREAAGKDAN